MSDLTPGNNYNASFKACVSEAAKRGRHLMDRIVQHIGTMQGPRIAQMMDAGDRKLQNEALFLLSQHRTALVDSFPQILLAEFAQAISGSASSGGADLSFGALELMGDEQVQESVEVLRARQASEMAVEPVIGELNSLVSTAQGLRTVHAQSNPLRPEVYVRGLRSAIVMTGVSAEVRLRWMQFFGEALGAELAVDYVALSTLLRDAGVVEAGFNVVQTPSAGQIHREVSPVPVATAGPQTQLNIQQLKRLLSGDLDAVDDSFGARFSREFESGNDVAAASADFSHTMPAAYEVLQEMKQVDKVVDRLIQRKEAGPDDAPAGKSAVMREKMRQQARGTGQALGLEVVGLMVDNITTDERLLPEVRHSIRELEPALLRLALVDPRFFSDKAHPARELLDRVTRKSMAWKSPDSAGFVAFLGLLRQAVHVLLTTKNVGPEPFAYALASMEKIWAEQGERERERRAIAVQTLVHAEQRNGLASAIGKGLRSRAEAAMAPLEIVQFLVGPWAQVIAEAQLADTDGKTDPKGYEDLVTDLLWSALPAVAGTNPARLVKMIPGLLEKLTQGLESIGFPHVKTSRFFETLQAVHAQVCPPSAGSSRRVEASARERLEAQFRDGDEAALWLAPAEAQQSGFLDTQDAVASVVPLFEATQPGFKETQIDVARERMSIAQNAPEALNALARLDVGDLVEFWMNEEWSRAQLNWVSQQGALYMFNNAEGVNQSMTRQGLERLAGQGMLRVLADQAVVDAALDGVARTALQNSTDRTSIKS